MSEYEYKVTVIIPVYNAEKYLRQCLDSLLSQTIDKSQIEVIMINDGSTDASEEICEEYCNQNNNFKLYTQKNSGSAMARNLGVEVAKGKYLAYLDSDDRLSANVLKDTTEFFDKHYDEIDEVTYKIVHVQGAVKKESHYRYGIMNKTGVYDLTQGKNIYISQTNMNIVVKNKGDANVLFDCSPNFRHEDMLYSTEILREKKKIGFVDTCEYLYERNPQSVVSNFYCATVFEPSVSKWEELFASFTDELPEYIQALFVNDIQWKMKADILLPHHLEGDDYDRGVARLRALLQRVDNKVILEHPECAQMNMYYFLDMKYDGKIKAELGNSIVLSCDDGIIYQADSVKLTVTRFRFDGDTLQVGGHLSSPAFKYTEKPKLLIRQRESMSYAELFDSSFCYDDAKVKNNQAWGFNATVNTAKKTTLSFKIEIGEICYDVDFSTGEWVAFNKTLGRNKYIIGNKLCEMTDKRIVVRNATAKQSRKYSFERLFYYLKANKKVFFVRLLNMIIPKRKPIWLYNDCKAVGRDNAYYQFKHDFYKDDGVDRYYVVNGDINSVSGMFDTLEQKHLIKFRSAKHKLLYLKADRVITAFIEKVNYIPFYDDVYMHYLDIFGGKVVYLQHGVLHAHLPWKYAYDRLDLSYEVVSTDYEVKNFTENYCFPKESLIKSKMPRFDFIDYNALPDGNRILFAPSWRKYLISMKGDGSWVETKDKFLNSNYYIKTMEFLNSKSLETLLEENDWYLDFKPHPIFSLYNKYFEITNPRVKQAEDAVQSDYKVLMTDYSSFVFDFVYLDRAIIYFMPDYRQFKSGMNDYRELDIPFENGFGELTQTADEAVAAVERIIKNDGKALPPFSDKNNEFFFDREKDCRKKIYEEIK